ncbi:unnamed protein product [Choristocarpus tenellus]
MEALKALRQWTMGGKRAGEDEQHYIIGGKRFLKSTVTAWRSTTNKEFYNLEALVVLLEYANESMADYIAAAIRVGVKYIASIERAEALAYLRGQTSGASQIQTGPETEADSSSYKRPRSELDQGGERVICFCFQYYVSIMST